MYFIKSIVCKMRGHQLTAAGSCPFTGITYDYCSMCTAMIPKENLS